MATVTAPPPTKKRMTLQGVTQGRIAAPLRVLLYGVEGIGKSTFGARAPSPIFLGAEDGTAELDVARLPQPETWQDVIDALRLLAAEKHEYQTLVVDTIDWLEPLVWRHICDRDKKASVEDYGYGKGYVAALDEWRVFIAELEALRRKRGMHIVLLAHCVVKAFKNPEGDDFDRYQMKVHDKAGGLLKEWPDDVLFANYRTFAVKDSKTKRVRGVDDGARVVYTTRRAAYDAKNRHSLPDELPLSWDDFYAAVQRRQVASPAELRAAIETKVAEVDEATRVRVRAAVEKAGDDAAKLAEINNKLNQMTTGKGD
jgi:hypothetical protein